MKTVEKWRWKTLWIGKMTAGKVHYTEEEIKARHPEAERVPGTMILVEAPETEEEQQAAQNAMRRAPRDFKP